MPEQTDFIAVMAKHLPPSASQLHLLDVGAMASKVFTALRADLMIQSVSINAQDWQMTPNTVDAIVAYDRSLDDDFLAAGLHVMRPGGRLIIVNPAGSVQQTFVTTLETAGYVRILVEPAWQGQGVLIRGEKPHTATSTHQRVRIAADQDASRLSLETYRGRYVYLLIQQSPNKPVWRLQPHETVHWSAIAIAYQTPALLAFSSLPKAVAFMQPAVMQGFIRDVNKVGKFSLATAHTWSLPVMLNPVLTDVQHHNVTTIAIDPQTAEAPDE